MERISVDLKNCYGIKALQHEFNSATGRAFLIYAPNGSMKTSLAKVFRDISEGKQPRDAIFPERQTLCSVTVDSGTPLNPDDIFVVDPYQEAYFDSPRVATLLANEDLKRSYESIHASIDNAKTALLSDVGRTAGIRRNFEQETLAIFNATASDIYSVLEGLEAEVNADPDFDFSDIAYAKVFNPRVQEFLASSEIAALLHEYVTKYDELIGSSLYFRKGTFNHNNASTVSKNLKDNGFFAANHSVSLVDASSQRKEVSSQKEFDDVIQSEKLRILNDPELSKRFEDVDKAITRHADLREFRTYLEQNPKLLPELADLERLKRKMWTSYLVSNRVPYDTFLEAFRNGKKEIEAIIKKAKGEATIWHEVVRIFNERFSVPFVLEIANQDDVILKAEAPSLIFKYQDGSDLCEVGRDDLLNVLSTGEKRALYILNVIFELESRSNSSDRTLLVLDDIADSFDYKNKYAIIEYMRDNLEKEKFFMIILTHNFDFFRTVHSRLDINREHNCLMTQKNETQVRLIRAEYLQPFTYWKNNLHQDNTMLIASIPMVRNLVEYTKGQDSPIYAKLTSLLHQKSDSDSITLAELAEIINETLSLGVTLGPGTVLPLIFEVAEKCLNEPDEGINLENKVVLSIAIRLRAEAAMLFRINDPPTTNAITSNQMLQLFKIYKNLFPSNTSEIDLLDQVVMITPEPIHLNSFMYEPLIDISDHRLKELYSKIKVFGSG